MSSQEASSSGDRQERAGVCGRQTAPHLHPHSPPSGSLSSGPGRQHTSCRQSLNVQEAGKEKMFLKHRKYTSGH